MSMDSGLSVLWISRVIHRKGMYNIVHSHNYFHFSCTTTQNPQEGADGRTVVPHPLSCVAPDTPHGGNCSIIPDTQGINIMFLVQDKTLYKMIESFPFERVKVKNAHSEFLMDIIELCHKPGTDAGLINAAVSYYLRRVMKDNEHLIQTAGTNSLTDRCMAYIDRNYMNQITLEDVANHIGRSRNYTSSIFNNAVGMNLMEYVNSVRIRNACALIAYSDISMEDVALRCGFTNHKHFGRVFKNVVGTSPVKYRTSHATKDCRFEGDDAVLREAYRENEDVFTYIVNAQKFVKWRTPEEYVQQQPYGELS